MAAPSLTNTLTNGNPNDADEVMTNFNDLLNGITDGTKDLTCSAFTANGNVTLGNADGDVTSVNSILTLARSNLAKTSVPVANSVYPNNMVNAWALLTLGAAGSITVTAGFNVDTATYSDNDITVNFHTNMADANYAVSTSVDSSDLTAGTDPQTFSYHTKAVGSFVIACYAQGVGSDVVDYSVGSGDVVQILVVGNQ